MTAETPDAPGPELLDIDPAHGETFELKFDEPGRYPYFCAIHDGPGMAGEIIVE